MVVEQLLILGGAALVLYLLIKAHLYTIRRLWVPKFEEELEANEDDEGEEPSGDDGTESQPSGWDHVG